MFARAAEGLQVYRGAFPIEYQDIVSGWASDILNKKRGLAPGAARFSVNFYDYKRTTGTARFKFTSKKTYEQARLRRCMR